MPKILILTLFAMGIAVNTASYAFSIEDCKGKSKLSTDIDTKGIFIGDICNLENKALGLDYSDGKNPSLITSLNSAIKNDQDSKAPGEYAGKFKVSLKSIADPTDSIDIEFITLYDNSTNLPEVIIGSVTRNFCTEEHDALSKGSATRDALERKYGTPKTLISFQQRLKTTNEKITSLEISAKNKSKVSDIAGMIYAVAARELYEARELYDAATKLYGRESISSIKWAAKDGSTFSVENIINSNICKNGEHIKSSIGDPGAGNLVFQEWFANFSAYVEKQKEKALRPKKAPDL